MNIPKVIALRVWISQVRFGYLKDSLSDLHTVRGSVAKLLPVIKPTRERLRRRLLQVSTLTDSDDGATCARIIAASLWAMDRYQDVGLKASLEMADPQVYTR